MLKMIHFVDPQKPGDALVFHNEKYGLVEDNKDYKDCKEDGLIIEGVYELTLESGDELLPDILSSFQ